MKLRNIKTFEPLTPKVTNLLRNAIINGDIKPGERLNETLISGKLGISRSPIREAFKILESENLVETYGRRGTFVKDLSIKEIDEIYTVIKLINLAATRLAASHMNEARKKELVSIMKKVERIVGTHDIDKVKPLSTELHTFIMKASENSLLLKIHNNLRIQQERFRIKGTSYGATEIADIVNEHITILKALLNGDANEAELLMANHVDNARSRVLNALRKNNDINLM